jgi:phosphomannomutase
MGKKKVEIGDSDPDTILDELKKKYAHENCNTVDGLNIKWSDLWVHMRKSNTEPIMRVYSEAPTADEAHDLGNRFMDEIKKLMR